MINFINIQYTMDSRTLKTIRHLMSLCFCVCVGGGGVTVFVECWMGAEVERVQKYSTQVKVPLHY